MKKIDIAWLAGLLEGEGYFGLQRKNYIWISIEMTDEDIIRRVQKLIAPEKSIEIRDNSKRNGKPSYRIYITGRDKVETLLETIRPFMGNRRGKRIDEMLLKSRNSRYREENKQKEIEETKRLYSTGKVTQEILGRMFGVTAQAIRYRLSL